jgi:hypothetical protein
MNKTLYIIGNGFDIHHGVRSTYKDFGNSLKAHEPETYRLIEDYFTVDDEFWSSFEARLADFDAETLIERASDSLAPYATPDWSDSLHHDYQFEIEQVVEGLSTGLRSHFAKWIRQLEIPDPNAISLKLLPMNAEATFLNFNYTRSLTSLYGVGPSRVLHIHGSAADADNDLVLGHGWNPAEKGSSNDGLDLDETDTRVVDGNRIIDGYFKRTFKPTRRVIAVNQSFFGALHDVQEIIVMGHSLADVDLPYFKEIIRQISILDVRWRISYYSGDDPPNFRDRLEMLGVPGHVIEFFRLGTM